MGHRSLKTTSNRGRGRTESASANIMDRHYRRLEKRGKKNLEIYEGLFDKLFKTAHFKKGEDLCLFGRLNPGPIFSCSFVGRVAAKSVGCQRNGKGVDISKRTRWAFGSRKQKHEPCRGKRCIWVKTTVTKEGGVANVWKCRL